MSLLLTVKTSGEEQEDGQTLERQYERIVCGARIFLHLMQ